MIFAWDEWNARHIARHGVTREEAKAVVEAAHRPYPEYHGNGKWRVRGVTLSGRWLQVIYVERPSDKIDLEMLEPMDRLFIQDVDEVGYVIHARELTESERHSTRKHGDQR